MKRKPVLLRNRKNVVGTRWHDLQGSLVDTIPVTMPVLVIA
jgi:hypothetical protein